MANYFQQSELRQDGFRAGAENDDDARRMLFEIRQELDREYPLPETIVLEPRQAPSTVFDVFLSYSSVDALAVLGLYVWLTRQGYIVYLDCFDPALPNPAIVNRQTAEVLRRRMVQSRSLFVATSQNTPTSAWVPWELGFTDGLTNRAAVLYLASGRVAFNRQSYFELYPEVLQNAGPAKPRDLWIVDSLARPALNCDWGTWLRMPKLY